jgi:hypothetical protein
MSHQLHAAYVQMAQISSPRDTARSDGSGRFGCLQANGQSPWHPHLHERTRSQGPFLHRRYPASSVVRPCPTPADIAIQDSVEAATLMPYGSPPITRITVPACRAHYPGGSKGCTCRLLPHPYCLPRFAGGSASASLLSRPAQDSLALRPVGLLNRPRRPLSRGFDPASYPAKPLVSYQSNRQLPGWYLPPLVTRAFGAHCKTQELCNKSSPLIRLCFCVS